MKISTYFIWIFMTYSVSLIQTGEHPLPTFHQYSVIIQYTNNQYNFTEWRKDKQKIDWRRSEMMIRFAVKNLISNMKKTVSDVGVHVWRNDCKTGNSSRVENIVSDINHCSYNGSDLLSPIDDKSCITVHIKILQLDESPNWKKECDDWLKEFQEYFEPTPAMAYLNPVFIEVLLAIILLGVLLVSVVIFVYIKMRVTGKSTPSKKDPSYFGSFAPLPFDRGWTPPAFFFISAGDDEEAQNRLTLDLSSAERIRHSKDLSIPNLAGDDNNGDDDDNDGDNDDGEEGQDRLSAGLNPTEGRCTKSMDNLPPTMAGDDGDDDDDDDEGQNRVVAGLTPAAQSWNSRNVSTPNLAFGRNYQ